MEWIDAAQEPPTEYKDYVCLIDGKMTIATLREFIYDVRQPNWDKDGVTHYLSDIPALPNIPVAPMSIASATRTTSTVHQ